MAEERVSLVKCDFPHHLAPDMAWYEASTWHVHPGVGVAVFRNSDEAISTKLRIVIVGDGHINIFL